jgi:hypothetical protein
MGNGEDPSHLVEVDFKDFPRSSTPGSITVNNKTRICSPPFDNFWKASLRKGELHLTASGRSDARAPGPAAGGGRSAPASRGLAREGAQAVAGHVLRPALSAGRRPRR